MGWIIPQYTQAQVNAAGESLKNNILKGEWLNPYALRVVDNFRSAHGFPLNTIQANLRNHAKSINSNSIIAQRLKRLSSILNKLERFPDMKFARMQDIGGCRAIMKTITQVNHLADIYTNHETEIRHIVLPGKDYIQEPKADGYRSRHLVFQYQSDRNTIYNQMKIEMQIRTLRQHAWATASETVGTFLRQDLKSGKASSDWERLFQLMSTEIAYREGCPLVPGIPSDRKLWQEEIKTLEHKLQAIGTLGSLINMLYVMPFNKETRYLVLLLDLRAKRLSIKGYDKLDEANKDYIAQEEKRRQVGSGDVVLLSVGEIKDLKAAYPNYYADTAIFNGILSDCVGKQSGS